MSWKAAWYRWDTERGQWDRVSEAEAMLFQTLWKFATRQPSP